MICKAVLVAASLCVLSFCSCATHRATINSYTDPNFNAGARSLAIFPIRNARLAPSEAQQLNRMISQELTRRRPSLKLVSPAEVVRLLNEKGLAEDWANFLEDYSSSGVPNVETLQRIGEAVRVDVIYQAEIVNVFQQDGQYGGNKGRTRVTVRATMLDTKRGTLVWEATSDGIRGTATTMESAPPIYECIELALQKILSTLPM